MGRIEGRTKHGRDEREAHIGHNPYPQEIPPLTRQIGDVMMAATNICHFLGHQLEDLHEEGGRPAFSPLRVPTIGVFFRTCM